MPKKSIKRTLAAQISENLSSSGNAPLSRLRARGRSFVQKPFEPRDDQSVIRSWLRKASSLALPFAVAGRSGLQALRTGRNASPELSRVSAVTQRDDRCLAWGSGFQGAPATRRSFRPNSETGCGRHGNAAPVHRNPMNPATSRQK